jgi:hypothetical protein
MLLRLCQNATQARCFLNVRNTLRTNRARISDFAPYSLVHG